MKKYFLPLITALLLTGSAAFAGEGKEKCCCGKDKAACAACSNPDKPCSACAKMEKEKEKK